MPQAFETTAADDLELLRSAAVAAGMIAASFFRRDLKTWTKENASPVTEADITVDRYLRGSLIAARPAYGWLSEESPDDLSRLDARRVDACFHVGEGCHAGRIIGYTTKGHVPRGKAWQRDNRGRQRDDRGTETST